MTKKYDFLIIGSGVAGMSYALKVAEANKGKIAIICKTTLEEANTAKAQGGIASVTNLLVDNFDKHIEDTMIAGDWISDPEAVRQVVTNDPRCISDLVKWVSTSTRKKTAPSTFTAKADTQSSAYSTMQTTQEQRYSEG